jgi:hypothetical protein
MKWEDSAVAAENGSRRFVLKVAFIFENQEKRRPPKADSLGEIANRPLFMVRPDSPCERALSRSWMAKGVFTLNGKPSDNIREYLDSLDRFCAITLPGRDRCRVDGPQLRD